MPGTIVETRCGKVEGIDKGAVLQFRGVPYAAPPVGSRRYRPPEPPAPWAGVRPATEFGPAAPQAGPPDSPLPRPSYPRMDEDCLVLNVFAPATPAPEGRLDPANVTVFGESAGGASVSTLLGTPAAGGLFHRAIPQSGAAWTRTIEDADRLTDVLLAALELDRARADRLLTVTVDELLNGQLRVAGGRTPRRFGDGFLPLVDGVVLPQSAYAAIRAGASPGVAVMNGTTRDEMTLFALADPRFANLDDRSAADALGLVVGRRAREMCAAYGATRHVDRPHAPGAVHRGRDRCVLPDAGDPDRRDARRQG